MVVDLVQAVGPQARQVENFFGSKESRVIGWLTFLAVKFRPCGHSSQKRRVAYEAVRRTLGTLVCTSGVMIQSAARSEKNKMAPDRSFCGEAPTRSKRLPCRASRSVMSDK